MVGAVEATKRNYNRYVIVCFSGCPHSLAWLV